MSRIISRCLVAIAYIVIGTVALRPVAAQHHGGHHGSYHHGDGHGSSHYGGHHTSWLHFVPSHHHHHHTGLYYSYGGANYYTPYYTPPVQVLRPQIDVRPGFNLPTPPPTEPIAPQSVKLVFGGFQQAEDLSGRLEIEANRWCLDMHHNYRHNLDFAATYREAYDILLAATYVHSAEHRNDRTAIRQQLVTVDPLFHHVQEKIKSWTREEHRPVGEEGINGKAEVIESILHHLLYDVGIEEPHGAGPEERAPPPTAAAPQPRLR